MGLVIVGASLGGLRAAQALRSAGFGEPITLLGAERHLPYDRPPLSKGFLSGAKTADDIVLGSARTLADLDVSVRLGVRATDLELDARRVVLHGGETVGFDTLVIATGATARVLGGLAPLLGVHTLRTLDDALAIRADLARSERLAVIGGGFIGSEVAATATALGIAVTVFDPLPTLMVRALGPVLSEAMTALHHRSGVELRLDVGVSALEGDGRVQSVRLTDGASVAADTVVIGVGAAPATGWLEGSGLEIRDGVVCDEFLAARGATGVYALGDVARWHNPRYAEEMRVEHWTAVGEQASALAQTLTGRPTACEALPYVWSEQFGLMLQIFGRVRPHDDVRFVEGGPDADSFVAISGGDGLLQAVVGLASVRGVMPYRKLLRRGASWDEALAQAVKG